MVESITKIKRVKIALSDRAKNNFFRHCKNYLTIEKTNSLEEYMVLFKPMAKSLSAIITDIEEHQTPHDDIKDIEVIDCSDRNNLVVKFTRYRNCKLQPIQLSIVEHEGRVVQINPSIPQ